MKNVIQFTPQEQSIPLSVQESQEILHKVRSEFGDEVAADVFEMLLNNIASYGVTIRSNGEFTKDLIFLEETIRSFIYKSLRVQHQFQGLVQDVISLPEDKDDEEEEELAEQPS